MKATLGALLCACALGGCQSVEYSARGSLADVDVCGADGPCTRMVHVSNGAFYAFGRCKLVGFEATGSAVLDKITRIAAQENCDIVDLFLYDASSSSASIASHAGWAGFILGYGEYCGSAVLRPRKR